MLSGIFILAIYFLLHFINIFQLIVWKHQASMGILISPKPDFPLHTHTSIKPLAKCDNKTSGRKKKCGISGSGWEGDFPYAIHTLLLFPDLFTFWLLQTFPTICLHLLKGSNLKVKKGFKHFGIGCENHCENLQILVYWHVYLACLTIIPVAPFCDKCNNFATPE